jgi:hypothetical protein
MDIVHIPRTDLDPGFEFGHGHGNGHGHSDAQNTNNKKQEIGTYVLICVSSLGAE